MEDSRSTWPFFYYFYLFQNHVTLSSSLKRIPCLHTNIVSSFALNKTTSQTSNVFRFLISHFKNLFYY